MIVNHLIIYGKVNECGKLLSKIYICLVRNKYTSIKPPSLNPETNYTCKTMIPNSYVQWNWDNDRITHVFNLIPFIISFYFYAKEHKKNGLNSHGYKYNCYLIAYVFYCWHQTLAVVYRSKKLHDHNNLWHRIDKSILTRERPHISKSYTSQKNLRCLSLSLHYPLNFFIIFLTISMY